jgi:hypothetical protein
MREVFRYYQSDLGQLHRNEQIILFTFDKFFKLTIIKPTINIFRTCYHLVTNTDGGNDMHWFFTFANRLARAMKGALYGNPTHVKK